MNTDMSKVEFTVAIPPDLTGTFTLRTGPDIELWKGGALFLGANTALSGLTESQLTGAFQVKGISVTAESHVTLEFWPDGATEAFYSDSVRVWTVGIDIQDVLAWSTGSPLFALPVNHTGAAVQAASPKDQTSPWGQAICVAFGQYPPRLGTTGPELSQPDREDPGDGTGHLCCRSAPRPFAACHTFVRPMPRAEHWRILASPATMCLSPRRTRSRISSHLLTHYLNRAGSLALRRDRTYFPRGFGSWGSWVEVHQGQPRRDVRPAKDEGANRMKVGEGSSLSPVSCLL
jgi:hypothetical protein